MKVEDIRVGMKVGVIGEPDCRAFEVIEKIEEGLWELGRHRAGHDPDGLLFFEGEAKFWKEVG